MNGTRQQRRSRRQSGFTLVELMIAVAIIAIITAIALPSYQAQVEKSRRADAQSVLMEAAQYMERFYTENNRYDRDTGDTAVALPAAVQGSPKDGDTKYYAVTIQAVSRSAYTLRATPQGSQAGNGFLEVTNTGARAWDENNDGTAESTWH